MPRSDCFLAPQQLPLYFPNWPPYFTLTPQPFPTVAPGRSFKGRSGHMAALLSIFHWFLPSVLAASLLLPSHTLSLASKAFVLVVQNVLSCLNKRPSFWSLHPVPECSFTNCFVFISHSIRPFFTKGSPFLPHSTCPLGFTLLIFSTPYHLGSLLTAGLFCFVYLYAKFWE